MKAFKVSNQTSHKEAQGRLVQMYPDKAKRQQQEFLICPSVDGMHRVRISSISHCQAEGNYARIFIRGGGSILLSKALGSLDESLPGTMFIRVHQSYLVARKCILRFNPKAILLDCGVEIPVARSRKNEVKEAFLMQGLRIS